MDLVLLRSTARKRIVASARVMRHRQIPVIEQWFSASRTAPRGDRRTGGELELALRELRP
jgi:hypothetical protein